MGINQERVRQFHEAFGLVVDDPDAANPALRARLIAEESAEAVFALGRLDYDFDHEGFYPSGLNDVAKELADVLYVVYGAAVELGFDLDAIFEIVHRSNMSKLVNGEPIRDHNGKVLKGPLYEPPSAAEIRKALTIDPIVDLARPATAAVPGNPQEEISMIIGITGLAASGKDTAAAILVEEYGYTRLGFADQLKKLALAIDPVVYVDLDGDTVRLSEILEQYGDVEAKAKFREVRRFYQQLGTKARDFLGSDVWIEAWRKALPTDVDTITETDFGGQVREFFLERVLDTVTPDVRFLNEADAITDQGGVIIRVVREGSGLTGSAGQHPSEIEQSEIDADYVLDNNSDIPALRAKVAEIMRDLGNVAA